MQKGTEAAHADLAALDETVLATAARWYGSGPTIVRQGIWSAFDEEDYRMVIKCSGRNYVSTTVFTSPMASAGPSI
ncbi:hypothetical protein SAMN04489742_3082 [Arthrobacter crystallopoietes]|uniref:Uncharacterized protein n=1 Tax=Crystallibacter crystallopoietes TaxID=37928 RepID=A0A1H1EV29_9MICC|nr:hypothetical protein SAMN04489742_3082 [Arthrobacter crystallopoietes]